MLRSQPECMWVGAKPPGTKRELPFRIEVKWHSFLARKDGSKPSRNPPDPNGRGLYKVWVRSSESVIIRQRGNARRD